MTTNKIMEAPNGDGQKLPDMVMCGDHPSLTKAELNVSESKTDVKEKEKPKEKTVLSHTKISARQSVAESGGEVRALAASEHALRMQEARRRARDRSELVAGAAAARPVVQAFPAMGSFRWPPYLLAVWVLVLVLTHLLHCIVNILERALPALKKCTNYFRKWTEMSWKNDSDINQKVRSLSLGAITGLLYSLYFILYAVYSIAVWSIEPLCTDSEDNRTLDVETKVIDYVDVVTGKTNFTAKQ